MAHVYDYIGAHNPETYDLENEIADPEWRIEAFMESRVSLAGIALADIGAGGGYHACRFARRAAQVYAVEPAPRMLRHLYARVARSDLTNVSILAANAEAVPLREGWVDVVHARFAYFFGAESGSTRSCEPGIAEAMRILKPGGTFFIIDNALTTGQFAEILAQYGYARGKSSAMQEANDAFYTDHGFQHATVESSWTAPDRQALRRVMAMEFDPQFTDAIMAEIDGAALSYHYRIYSRRKEV
jgi:ubiquinone/menaquinone biosynthesis C-methylase UbiE